MNLKKKLVCSIVFLIGLIPAVIGENVSLPPRNNSSKEITEVQKVLNISKSDKIWLAMNIFHEARGENLHGRLAVAFVTLNRVVHESWPDTVKEVIQQPYQFSWYNSKKIPAIRIEEAPVWEECKTVADLAIDLYNSMAESKDFEVDGLTRGADHYFADYIAPPAWAKKMKFQAKIGRHLFYSKI